MNLDFAPLIDKRRARFAELEKEIADPSLFDDAKRHARSCAITPVSRNFSRPGTNSPPVAGSSLRTRS